MHTSGFQRAVPGVAFKILRAIEHGVSRINNLHYYITALQNSPKLPPDLKVLFKRCHNQSLLRFQPASITNDEHRYILCTDLEKSYAFGGGIEFVHGGGIERPYPARRRRHSKNDARSCSWTCDAVIPRFHRGLRGIRMASGCLSKMACLCSSLRWPTRAFVALRITAFPFSPAKSRPARSA